MSKPALRTEGLRAPAAAAASVRVRTPRRSVSARSYDLLVIGAGPAGLRAAELAARLGASVALFEPQRLGGTSLNTGSIPSKALIRSASLFAGIRETTLLQKPDGRELPIADFRKITARLRQIEERIGGYHSLERLQRLGIDVYREAARFTDPQTLATHSARFHIRKALIATGARSLPAAIPGLKEGMYVTSESIFALERLPERLAVIGGGPLGCELAQAFCRLGSEVTIIQDEAKFLPMEERDAAQVLAQSMALDGVRIFLNTRVIAARTDGAATALETKNYRTRNWVSADQVLLSIGREPNTGSLDLAAAGIACGSDKAIVVDQYLRTTNPRVYAAGDVCMPHKYTHVAQSTGQMAALNALKHARHRHTNLTIPWCTYCVPEVAHVGLQVWQARERSIRTKTYTIMMQDVDRAITDQQDTGFVKLHVAEGTDRILGATIVASRASEMINEVCVAMHTGIGLRALAQVLHTFPSQSAAIRLAAISFGELPDATPEPVTGGAAKRHAPRRRSRR